MLFFIILYIYIKYDIKSDKKINNYSLVLSIILSMFLSVGTIYSRYMYTEIIQVINLNNIILSDFILLTYMVLWSILSLRKVLFNNLNMAVAFSTIIQMLLISLLFTLVIKYLYELGIPKKYVTLLQ